MKTAEFTGEAVLNVKMNFVKLKSPWQNTRIALADPLRIPNVKNRPYFVDSIDE